MTYDLWKGSDLLNSIIWIRNVVDKLPIWCITSTNNNPIYGPPYIITRNGQSK